MAARARDPHHKWLARNRDFEGSVWYAENKREGESDSHGHNFFTL
jgi:hypothetical protein